MNYSNYFTFTSLELAIFFITKWASHSCFLLSYRTLFLEASLLLFVGISLQITGLSVVLDVGNLV